MSSVRAAVDGDLNQSHLSQEALLQPVRDMGHSEILRGHFWGTQPFEKGLGFPHRVPDLRGWEDMRLRGQVRAGDLLGREHLHKMIRVCGAYQYVDKFLKWHIYKCFGSSLNPFGFS